MADPTLLKRLSAVSVATMILGLGALNAGAQEPAPTPDLSRVNQDELASFYGRMNVVVGSGARAFGMGGAFLARADDATAASWNPAGLSYLRRTEFSLVGVHNDFSQRIPRYDGTGAVAIPVTTVDQLQGSVTDFVGIAYPLRIRERAGAIQVSYQRSFSFTGNRRAEGARQVSGFGRDGAPTLATEFTVEGKGGFDSLSVSSGFEVHPSLRLGVSVNRWVRGFNQSVVRPERVITSTWDIRGTNFNLGLLYTPTPKLNLGAVVKTPFGANVRLSKSRTDFSSPSTVPGASVTTPRALYFEGDVLVRFPGVYGVGASFRPTNTITISADFTRTSWSKSNISGFFSLAAQEPFVEKYSTLPFPAVEAAGQADTSQLRVGGEWVLRFGSSGDVLFPVRLGFFRDGQPGIIELREPRDGIIDVTQLELTRFQPTFTGFSAGFGVTVGGVLFDVAYIRERGELPASRARNQIRDSTQTVKYNRLFGSMIVRFGPRR